MIHNLQLKSQFVRKKKAMCEAAISKCYKTYNSCEV